MLARFSRGMALALLRLPAAMAYGSPMEAPVDNVTVLYGRHASGNVQSLMAQDGEAMRFCRFTVPSADIYPLTLRFEGHLGSTPSSLSFSIIGKSSAFGVYSQSLNLYDWTKGLFEPNTNSTALLPKSYGRMDCLPWSEAWRYVRPSDKKVMALVRVKVIGVEASAGWPADYDRAWFTYEPGV